MKHALLWELLHAITVENHTTTPKCASESHTNQQEETKETENTTQGVTDLTEDANILENPNTAFTMNVMTAKEPMGLGQDPQEEQNREYQDQSSDYTSTNKSDDSSTNSDDECYMQHLKTHQTSQNKTSQGKTCTKQINGNDTQVEPDTGSDNNIMDKRQFKKVLEKGLDVTLKRSEIKFKALKEDLPVMGEADVFISNQTHS